MPIRELLQFVSCRLLRHVHSSDSGVLKVQRSSPVIVEADDIVDDLAKRLQRQGVLFFQPLLVYLYLGHPFTLHAVPVLFGGVAYQIPLLGRCATPRGEPLLWVVSGIGVFSAAHLRRWSQTNSVNQLLDGSNSNTSSRERAGKKKAGLSPDARAWK
jgi:hypothetical protein